ncbi:MAG: hypothetical protein ACRCSN_19405 [Dermatophilaceae bacterium]
MKFAVNREVNKGNHSALHLTEVGEVLLRVVERVDVVGDELVAEIPEDIVRGG